MPFKKGESGNPAGRAKGTVIKIGHGISQKLAEFLDDNFNTLSRNFKKLSPKDQLRFYLMMLPYTVCKRDEIPFHKMDESDIDLMLESTRQEFERLRNEGKV